MVDLIITVASEKQITINGQSINGEAFQIHLSPLMALRLERALQIATDLDTFEDFWVKLDLSDTYEGYSVWEEGEEQK